MRVIRFSPDCTGAGIEGESDGEGEGERERRRPETRAKLNIQSHSKFKLSDTNPKLYIEQPCYTPVSVRRR